MVTLVVGEARAEGYLYSCDTIEIKKLNANGSLPSVDSSQQTFGTVRKIFFDEASGIMRDGISTSNMKIIQKGTADNSLVAIDVYQGAGDSGAIPNNYPGFQPVTDPHNQAKFQELYGTEIDLEKGITKVAALDLCGDQIKAMLINGENTLISDPDRQHCERALNSLDHLVVSPDAVRNCLTVDALIPKFTFSGIDPISFANFILFS